MQKWEYCYLEISAGGDAFKWERGIVTFFKSTGEHETRNIHPPKKMSLLGQPFILLPLS